MAFQYSRLKASQLAEETRSLLNKLLEES